MPRQTNKAMKTVAFQRRLYAAYVCALEVLGRGESSALYHQYAIGYVAGKFALAADWKNITNNAFERLQFIENVISLHRDK